MRGLSTSRTRGNGPALLVEGLPVHRMGGCATETRIGQVRTDGGASVRRVLPFELLS